MRVSDIQILRDGGTILFTLDANSLSGQYRLQTPLRGEPRPLFYNGRKLGFGTGAEQELLASLQKWFAQSLTDRGRQALEQLSEMKVWKDLSADLLDAIPYHHMKTVLECLEKRKKA